MKSVAFYFLLSILVSVQTDTHPKEIRGYKVERAVVEVKKPDSAQQTAENDLIKFGDPRLVNASPLGIRLAIPIVVSPVKQKGEIDFLTFEDIVINGTSVQIEDYKHEFELPGKKPRVLKEPLKIHIFLPNAVLAALGEWTSSKDTWLVTGRVFVFGRFKKLLFSFKRCVPIELNLTIRNPLR